MNKRIVINVMITLCIIIGCLLILNQNHLSASFNVSKELKPTTELTNANTQGIPIDVDVPTPEKILAESARHNTTKKIVRKLAYPIEEKSRAHFASGSTNSWTFGISRFEADELGDIVFVEPPCVGDVISGGERIFVVESVKTCIEYYSAISGTVVMINDEICENPSIANSRPFTWVVVLEAIKY